MKDIRTIYSEIETEGMYDVTDCWKDENGKKLRSPRSVDYDIIPLHGIIISQNLDSRFSFTCVGTLFTEPCGHHIDTPAGEVSENYHCPNCWKEYFLDSNYTNSLYSNKQDLINSDLCMDDPDFIPAPAKQETVIPNQLKLEFA